MEDNLEKVNELETVILSAMINESSLLEDAFLHLTENDFANYKNQRIFLAIKNLYESNEVSDYIALKKYIENNPKLQFDDYKNYINDLLSLYVIGVDFRNQIELLRLESTKSHVNSFAKKLLNVNFDVINFQDQVFNLEKEFNDILNSNKKTTMNDMEQVVEKFKDGFNPNYDGKLRGVTSGIEDIDNMTNGFQAGDLIILAARPGIGKTALGLNFLLNAAKSVDKENNECVLMFSIEMGCEQICQRLVSIESLVENNQTSKKPYSPLELNSINTALDTLRELPIYIDDSSDQSIVDIQAKIKQLSLEKKIKLIVVDYLQLLKGPKSYQQQMNRQQEVAVISRMLKSIARTFSTPVIAIAQLSRKVEDRSNLNKKPILSDLRESGAIEQDADLVTFINYEAVDKDDDGNDNRVYNPDQPVEFIIRKHRNGATGEVKLVFKKAYGLYLPYRKGK